MAKLSLHIVDADYYLCKPIPNIDVCFSECRKREVVKVPVIRIFGATPQSQKGCLHIHGVFPYFYIPIPNDEVFPLDFGKKFATSLDIAIQVSLGKAISKQQDYVFSYEIVMKRPLYGYYENERKFLKISIYNPGLITKISELLINGAVMNQFFQPFETHIPYILQFFIDYNLHGMNLINLSHVVFRKPIPPGGNTTMRSPFGSPVFGSPTLSQTNYDVFNTDTVSFDMLLPDEICKQSTCSFECDTMEKSITNQDMIKTNEMNPGLKAIWDDEKQRRRENHDSSIIEMSTSQPRDRFKITEEERFQLERLKSVIDERITNMSSQYSSGGSESLVLSDQLDNEDSCHNQQDSESTTDQSLLDILIGMAEEGGEDQNFTPLSDTSIINNGLEEERDVNTEDEEAEQQESLIMSQTVFGEEIQQHVQNDKNMGAADDGNGQNDQNLLESSWSDSFLWRIPQYDGCCDMESQGMPCITRENEKSFNVNHSTVRSTRKQSIEEHRNNVHIGRNHRPISENESNKVNSIISNSRGSKLYSSKPITQTAFEYGRTTEAKNSKHTNNNRTENSTPKQMKTLQGTTQNEKYKSPMQNLSKHKRHKQKSRVIPQFDGNADFDTSDSSDDFKPSSAKFGVIYGCRNSSKKVDKKRINRKTDIGKASSRSVQMCSKDSLNEDVSTILKTPQMESSMKSFVRVDEKINTTMLGDPQSNNIDISNTCGETFSPSRQEAYKTQDFQEHINTHSKKKRRRLYLDEIKSYPKRTRELSSTKSQQQQKKQKLEKCVGDNKSVKVLVENKTEASIDLIPLNSPERYPSYNSTPTESQGTIKNSCAQIKQAQIRKLHDQKFKFNKTKYFSETKTNKHMEASSSKKPAIKIQKNASKTTVSVNEDPFKFPDENPSGATPTKKSKKIYEPLLFSGSTSMKTKSKRQSDNPIEILETDCLRTTIEENVKAKNLSQGDQLDREEPSQDFNAEGNIPNRDESVKLMDFRIVLHDIGELISPSTLNTKDSQMSGKKTKSKKSKGRKKSSTTWSMRKPKEQTNNSSQSVSSQDLSLQELTTNKQLSIEYTSNDNDDNPAIVFGLNDTENIFINEVDVTNSLDNFRDTLISLSFPSEKDISLVQDIETIPIDSPCPSSLSEEFGVVERKNFLVPESPLKNVGNNNDDDDDHGVPIASPFHLPHLDIFGSPFRHPISVENVNVDDILPSYNTPRTDKPLSFKPKNDKNADLTSYNIETSKEKNQVDTEDFSVTSNTSSVQLCLSDTPSDQLNAKSKTSGKSQKIIKSEVKAGENHEDCFKDGTFLMNEKTRKEQQSKTIIDSTIDVNSQEVTQRIFRREVYPKGHTFCEHNRTNESEVSSENRTVNDNTTFTNNDDAQDDDVVLEIRRGISSENPCNAIISPPNVIDISTDFDNSKVTSTQENLQKKGEEKSSKGTSTLLSTGNNDNVDLKTSRLLREFEMEQEDKTKQLSTKDIESNCSLEEDVIQELVDTTTLSPSEQDKMADLEISKLTSFMIKFRNSESDDNDCPLEDNTTRTKTTCLPVPDLSAFKEKSQNETVNSSSESYNKLGASLTSPLMFGQESFFYDPQSQSFGRQPSKSTSIEPLNDGSSTSIENCDIISGVMQLSDTDCEEDENDDENSSQSKSNRLMSNQSDNFSLHPNQSNSNQEDSNQPRDKHFLNQAIRTGANDAEENMKRGNNITSSKYLNSLGCSSHKSHSTKKIPDHLSLQELSEKPNCSTTCNEKVENQLSYEEKKSKSSSCNEKKQNLADGDKRISYSTYNDESTNRDEYIDTKHVEIASLGERSIVIKPERLPPTRQEVLNSLEKYNLQEMSYQEAFFGNTEDEGDVINFFSGRHAVKCRSKMDNVPAFTSTLRAAGALRNLQEKQIEHLGLHGLFAEKVQPKAMFSSVMKKYHDLLYGTENVVIVPCKIPPNPSCVTAWLVEKQREYRNDKSKELMKKLIKINIKKTGKKESRENHMESVGENSCNRNDSVRNDDSGIRDSGFKNERIRKNENDTQENYNKLDNVSANSSPNERISGNPSSQSKASNISSAPSSLQLSFGIDRLLNNSDIEGATLNNTYGFNHTRRNLLEAKPLHVNQHLTVVSVELHMQTRRDLLPDPAIDSIHAIFFTVYHDMSKGTSKSSNETGVFIFDPNSIQSKPQQATHGCTTHLQGQSNGNTLMCKSRSLLNSSSQHNIGTIETTCSHNSPQSSQRISTEEPTLNRSDLLKKTGYQINLQREFASEKEMLIQFAHLIQKVDPDFLVGYEVQMLSWGYMIERGAILDLNMCQLLSRIADKEMKMRTPHENSDNWFGQLINMTVTGRIMLNVWRVMRSEVTLQLYSFENVAYHVLHRRVPLFSFRTLSGWWNYNIQRWRVCQHYMMRCHGSLELLDQIDFVNRTSELARVFGILFYSVISRGSQYRVESMMLRTAKPLNYIPISPSVHQRSKMSAPECIPLVLEPESQLYVDPVIVLDFQSLYPSVIIAYNYCFSTCLGKVQSFAFNENYKFGAATLNLPLSSLKKLTEGKVHISPNGVGFVTSDVKRGVLPRMLEEILNTRIMVKNSMKKAKEDKVLHRMLDSRQLGLKLIANVTYGYTSANFSGRMPCIEIADSVVRKGRETLERAIHLVNTTKKWNARVVYGDTDSLFILAKGASKVRAFRIAQEIVEEVTALNPKPIKLKFEKIYQPCVLVTKKRYVGYSYESLDQKEPIFDAKGIETVRRDNCPAVGKILEKSIRTLFETKNVSMVKSYVQSQLIKIMEGRASLKEFIFAKEYRGMSSYKPGACVPSLILTRKLLKQDRRSEPRIGQRVPYVIVHGIPGLPLIQLVRRPMEVLDNTGLRTNEVYYITKQILPALGRIFSLLAVNVEKWYTSLPKIKRIQENQFGQVNNRKGTISHYFTSRHCILCEQLTSTNLCSDCRNNTQESVLKLSSRIWKAEHRHSNLTKRGFLSKICKQERLPLFIYCYMQRGHICQHCSGTWEAKTNCISLDCPVFFKLTENMKDIKFTEVIREILSDLS